MHRAHLLLFPILLWVASAACVPSEEGGSGNYAFAAAPACTRDGDRIEVSFAVKEACDATVAVEDAAGRIVRHLASGLLGKNAPAPFAKDALAQRVVWDGKDDLGRYVDDKDSHTVRVSLGLQARFERTMAFGGGQYEIRVRVDDGVRVYVDGKRLINNWQERSVRTVTATRQLNGVHTIRVDYFEAFDQARISVSISAVRGANEWDARYFDNPISFDQWGDSKQPDKRGSLHDAPSSGSVPLAEAVALGKGRNAYTQGGSSPSTKLVSDWIHVDEKALKYWRENAKRELEWAALSREVKEKLGTVYEVAVWRLSKRLREEVAQEIPPQNAGVFRDLIHEALATVNWTQVAEDLLGR